MRQVAAVYARTKVRDNDKIKGQLKYLADFAKKQGFKVIKTYTDNGESGITDKRSALTRLLADAEAGKIDTLISTEPTRLARNVNVQKRIDKKLKAAGVKNIYANQAASALEFANTMLAATMELERHMRSQNVRRGLQAAKERRAAKKK